MKDGQTTRVLCQNLICRRRSSVDFEQSFYHSVGSVGITDDFHRLYCHHFRSIDLNYGHPDPKIKTIIDSWNFDDFNLLNAQMVALISGFGDFFVRSNTFQEAKEYMRSSIDRHWEGWATERLGQFDRYLPYEEFLTIEPVDLHSYFRERGGNFGVEFDINMGEFDRLYKKPERSPSVPPSRCRGKRFTILPVLGPVWANMKEKKRRG